MAEMKNGEIELRKAEKGLSWKKWLKKEGSIEVET